MQLNIYWVNRAGKARPIHPEYLSNCVTHIRIN
jgi:hypothetical protein